MAGRDDPPITRLLEDWQAGDEEARDQATALLYDELRRLAAHHLRSERPGHSLRPTALVNDALVKLLGASARWEDRRHFLAVASRSMRQILVDHARSRLRQKRGSGARHVTLKTDALAESEPDVDVLSLHDALTRLAEQDARKAQVVELVYFGGLTYDEVAKVLEISKVTVHRELSFSKAWLARALS